MSTFLLLRDYNSLNIMTSTTDGDGRVYDLYNTSINKTINGEHNISFDILPYLDVHMIGHPNIIELDGDFYQVARVEKMRDSGVSMRVDGEHISYELNQSILDFEEDENTDLNYSGYPEEILAEMIDGTRFYIHPDFDVNIFGYETNFTTSQKGVRNRILELAAHCGVEVVFYRYSINFVQRIGKDKGVRLEVGKNIRSLTEVVETQVNGYLNKSYEVDIVDLNKVRDVANDAPEELFNIELGDTLRIVDGQFGINYVDRVKSISYDPFKSALPQIELANRIPSTANTSNVTAPMASSPAASGAALETARGTFSEGIEFRFTKPYSNLHSVTVSTTTPTADANIYYSEVKDWLSNFVGVKVHAIGDLSGIEVSMQAVVSGEGNVEDTRPK